MSETFEPEPPLYDHPIASDDNEFDFASRYGMDLLNHIARATLDRESMTAKQIRETVASKYEDIGYDIGELWEFFCADAVDILEDEVFRHLEEQEEVA